MPFSDIFHSECDPVEPSDAPHHVVFSCLQWKPPSLEVMPQAAKQSFAVMYRDPLNPYVTAILERAYILGAMSAVKLIAAHEDALYLFLDSGVSSTTFLEIESLWNQVMCMSPIWLTVDFANVDEIYSGHSDYLFWQVAKEILEIYSFRIKQYDLKALYDFSNIGFMDENLWVRETQKDGQPEAIHHCPVEMQDIAKITGRFKCYRCSNTPHYFYRCNRNSDA